MNAGEGSTVIGKAVKIVGDLSGSEDLILDGELTGTIQLSGARLTIGSAARVRADIVAQEVVIFGRLEGDIRCPGRVDLRSTAMVQGSIFAASLSVEDNAAFRGSVDPSRANEPLPAASQTAKHSTPAVPAPARVTPMPSALAAAAARPLASTAGESQPVEAPAALFADIKR